MSKIKPKRAFAKEVFTSFDGIRAGGADDMRNFRILADGSIEKRCGWETLHTLPDTVRGVWQGSLNGRSRCFAVCGSSIYSLDGALPTKLNSIATDEGRVRFLLYREHLYLLDGNRLYLYRNDSIGFAVAEGYVPLFGYNWEPSGKGDVHEPLNLLSNRLRMHYFNSSGSSTIRLPFYAESIESLRVDGVEDTAYRFTALGDSVTLSRIGSDIDIAFTVYGSSDHWEKLHNAAIGFCGRTETEEYMLLASDSHIYSSTPVSTAMLNGSLSRYSTTDPLYFKLTDVHPVGDNEHPVTAFHPERDRVLAFTTNGAASVCLSLDGGVSDCYTLPLSMGCTAPDASLSIDGDPVIINECGIFRLHAASDDPDRFYPTPLCEPMDFWKKQSFLSGAVCKNDRTNGELWFRDPSDENGLVWVYHILQKQWYCFDGISASSFFILDGKQGFASANRVCCFDESLTADDGNAIEAVYKSGFLGFSSPESVKRSLRVTLCGFGAEATLELESERRAQSYLLLTSPDTVPVCLDKRARFGRFRHLRFCLRDRGKERSRWSRLSLYSNL